MGAPFGNQNRSKAYRLMTTIEKVLRAKSRSDRLEALETMVEAQVAKASEGDLAAFRELMDRYAGRAQQSSDVTVTGNLAAYLAQMPKDTGADAKSEEGE